MGVIPGVPLIRTLPATVPDDLTTTDPAEVLDLPAPNEGEDGTMSTANTAIARWYAVQVASSCEKKVKATLEQRAITLGVSKRILEIEIPQTPAVKVKKDGSRQSTEEKVFPGYRSEERRVGKECER